MKRSDYRLVRSGTWRIWAHDELWDASVWSAVSETMEKQTPRGHPQTTRLRLRQHPEEAFLKTYSPGSFGPAFKDRFRASKAIRHWRQSLALAGYGFLIPPVIAAGEQRERRRIRSAFILTKSVPAVSLSTYLRGFRPEGRLPFSPVAKRRFIRKLGDQIGRMHDLGFVHGDMVLSNILVSIDQGEAFYYYIDHDRTRRYPNWGPALPWKRNLVQLNRLVLPGITLADRMRFFRAYSLARGPHRWRERRLLRWLEFRTRRRRLECDGVAADVSFRELMRWDGPYGGKARARKV